MKRLSGQDASFLYTETSTVLMHTLKIQIFDSPADYANDAVLRQHMEATLDVVPMLRQRVMFVPFNLHHPVLVDDPEFDLDFHIFRAALPAPGGHREFDQMISQILCHRLDRRRPLWELWVITGLEDGHVAVVHKIHHALADGAATVRYLNRVFERQAKQVQPPSTHWEPRPLPPGWRLLQDALLDHIRYDIRRLPVFLHTVWRSTRALIAFDRAVGSPTMQWIIKDRPPRTRFNHAISARRTFTTRQLSVTEMRAVGKALGGTLNDVLLAMTATSLRNYLLFYNELPDQPLTASIPVSADDPGSDRDSGNRTSAMPTCLWTTIADARERFMAIQKTTIIAKTELEVMGREFIVQLAQYLPPTLSHWKANRDERLRPADRPDFRPLTNVTVSNVPGPREPISGDYGALVDLYSMGPLIPGVGLNITAWSYTDHFNLSLTGCKKAVPDIDRIADAMLEAFAELQEVSQRSSSEQSEFQESSR